MSITLPTPKSTAFFAAFLLRDRINFHWQRYKQKHKAKNSIAIYLEKFKTFV